MTPEQEQIAEILRENARLKIALGLARNEALGYKAQYEGLASLLRDVQEECIALRRGSRRKARPLG